ncbi:MAG: hypothetical protein M1826_004814 [Phylliscum demangeonii]|nr:MAG: hypothetical protein M1826_004814 [Phylliscum demangeonii]
MKQLKKDIIEFLEGISDDKINHLYTPGIPPGTLFESKLLRLDWQKMTSGKDDQKKYNGHVQTNLQKKKRGSKSVAVALVPGHASKLKKDIIEFLEGISDDKINQFYTPGITPGLLFEGKLLRLDFQKYTSGEDNQRYNVHVQTNLHKTKKKQEWLCAKSESVAIALAPGHGSLTADRIREELIASIDAITGNWKVGTMSQYLGHPVGDLADVF